MSADVLAQDLALLSSDPHRFVLWAFPWSEPGTELEKFSGPESWQVQILTAVRDGLLTPNQAIQLAASSGHGVGKSALVAWLILWGISTFEDTRGVVTANTETQLKTKTWAELGKWHRLFLARDLFKLTATAIFSPERERTWRIDMVPWSERNTEAFAGLHNQGKRVILIMDEASAIPDKIHETAEGALTDANTQILWIMFGNPTRNTGRFREAFPGQRHANRWRTWTVDSREISFTNKAQVKTWVESYGEDSDFVRVRVRGVFPRTGSMEFISIEETRSASLREVTSTIYDPLILGVDVARFGDDESVIFFRKGRDARSRPPIRLRGVDTMAFAGRVAEAFITTRADAVFVDGTGVGGGVVDRLRQLQVPCFDIQFGAKPDSLGFLTGDSGVKYANKRAEMWGAMREWLKTGSTPSPDTNEGLELSAQLVGPLYGMNAQDAIQLERKEDMKKRGLASPDLADALALTFALPVSSRPAAGYMAEHNLNVVESEYNPFSPERLIA